jgi:hypothetical protein
MSTEDEYFYKPLDSAGGQVRLLALHMAFQKRAGPLRGTMKNYYLPLSTLPRSQRMKRMAAIPMFQALSYVWGDPTPTHEIIVDGKKIGITANLYQALADIQLAAVYDPLVWSDAVCICQKDMAERSAQVLLMREIYQAASEVCIWLEITSTDIERQKCFEVMSLLTGHTVTFSWEKDLEHEVEPEGRDALNLIYKPVSMVVRAGVGFGQAMVDIGNLVEATSDEKAEIIGLEESTQIYQKMIANFDNWRPHDRHLKRVAEEDLAMAANHIDKLITQDWSWFERIWVMQELGAADHPWIVAGGTSMTWEELVQVAWYLSTLSKSHELHRSRVALTELELIRRGFNENKRQSLYNLIRACRYRRAADPRDKIFALIGLMGDKMTPYLKPNYSIDVREIFARATLHFIFQYRKLDPICGWQTIGRTEGLPSWTPDYVLNQDLSMHPMDSMHMVQGLFNASGASHQGEYGYLDGETLLEPWFQLPVKGFVIDTIGSTSSSFPEASIGDTITLWLSAICTSPDLSLVRTEMDISELEEFAQAIQRYAQSSHESNTLLNILVPREPALPTNKFQTKAVCLFPDSYVVAAFIHCLFTGHILGNRLRPSDVEIMRNLDPQLATEESEKNIINAIGSSLQYGVRRRNIMVTKKGYIGTVQEDVVDGDLLCVLFGCSVPVILRRLDGDDRYVFLGESYVHSLMDAEAVVMQIKGELKERDFILC